jgi:hypothetical protein
MEKKWEDLYIQYLITNKDLVSGILDRFFTNQISFDELVIESHNINGVMPFRNFIKSKKIDDLTNQL